MMLENIEHPTFIGYRICWRWWRILEKKRNLYLASIIQPHTLYPHKERIEARCGLGKEKFNDGKPKSIRYYLETILLISILVFCFVLILSLVLFVVGFFSFIFPASGFSPSLSDIVLLAKISVSVSVGLPLLGSIIGVLIAVIIDLKKKGEKRSGFSPHNSCDCGIYGYHTKERALSSYVYGTILGKINFWGEMIKCEDGYRAQFGYPALIDEASCVRCGRIEKANSMSLLEIGQNKDSRLLAPVCLSCEVGLPSEKIARDHGWLDEITQTYGFNEIPQ